MKNENFPIETIIDLIKKSEETETFIDLIYDLYFFIGIKKGINDAKNEKGMSIEESRERMMRKYETYNTRYGS